MKKISISIRLEITRITILLTVAAAAQGGWIRVPLPKESSGTAPEMDMKPKRVEPELTALEALGSPENE